MKLPEFMDDEDADEPDELVAEGAPMVEFD
jgi:hypothetical protein